MFERTDKSLKTHHGVQREFYRLSKEDVRRDPELRRFLSRSYECKAVADYLSGPNPGVSPDEAAKANATAKRFMADFVSLVPLPDSSA